MKKRILTLLKILVVFFLMLIITGYFFVNNLKPTYEGNINLQGLQSTTDVYFDDYGIPHIYAKNETDAIKTLGYVHAQDRLWQMELLRRIAPGKLSEIFGEVAIENDKFNITLGIDEYSQKTVDSFDKNSETYKLSMAYLDGINQYIIEGKTPIEFYILGIDKKEFTLNDVHNIIGYMAFSFAMAYKTDPILSSLQAKLGNEYIKELGIDINPNSTLIKNYNNTNSIIAREVAKIQGKSPIPAFIGSNSWVVASEKAKNGKVLFANDPHIGYSSPSVWYEAHIKTPDFESYGYYLGGVPFPLLQHNREYAYGLTMFENDDLDFYQEENHPTDNSKYKTINGYKPYKISNKIITVKDTENIEFKVKSSIHGPLINDAIKGLESKKPLAMSWIYTKTPNKILEAIYKMSHANNVGEFKSGVSLIHAPGLNVMYGDNNGNISWIAAGKLYKLPEKANPKFVLNGTNGKDEIEEYLDFSQNPQAHNPPWNYVYSNNNQPDSIAGMLYPGYYLPEDRAKRTVQLLEEKNDFDVDDYKKMLNDSKSLVAEELSKIIVSEVKSASKTENEIESIKILENWDGNFVKSSIGATIYSRFVFLFMRNTFEDEITKEVFFDFVNTHIMKRMIAQQVRKEESIWWDNINTNEKEVKSDIFKKSFSETVSSLEKQLGTDVNSWTWNRVHKVEHTHPLGSVQTLKTYFNVGTYDIDGANEVLNQQINDYTLDATYNIHAGPSTRRIVDFSDVDNSWSILPTGNSGNPLSKHYRDQAEMFANGEFRKMRMNKEEIEKVSTKLILTSIN
ncbi:penicillin acylase family protein [Urechidicola croceus]|uniref:Penicillin acylase family protein n=1 Tax=Urechidicola croceus TaxID=1850246 RepID=A0A1D8PAF4_9FLAO|nr:penicillin acylase family protein [Urechidicola croceus]AOW21553.1 penicillin acylase family protein [Urechidicola croceus]